MLGKNLLLVSDTLVQSGDTSALKALHAVLVDMELKGYTADDVSLIEINEYVDMAIEALNQGKTAEEIKALSIRRLLAH